MLFERKVLCFCSPTGTGYLNYVMMETLEYLTGGDCATFAPQYSCVRRSSRWIAWQWAVSRTVPCCTP